MALSTPGYCTLTATIRPSGMTARWTCPIDAAAIGSGHQSRNSFSGSAPSSSRTTASARLGAIGGTSACRVASAACASGGRPSAMNEIIWPAFMMAPFMPPRTWATSSAVRMAKRSSSRARSSSDALRPRTFTAARWSPRRAVRRHTRSWRSKRWRRSASDRYAAPAPPAAAPAARVAASGALLTSLLGASAPGGLAAAHARLALGLGLVVHTEASGRHRLEPLLADGVAARLARAVGAVVETAQRVLDIGQLGFDLLEDREVLLPLERLGADVGLVLVETR